MGWTLWWTGLHGDLCPLTMLDGIQPLILVPYIAFSKIASFLVARLETNSPKMGQMDPVLSKPPREGSSQAVPDYANKRTAKKDKKQKTS